MAKPSLELTSSDDQQKNLKTKLRIIATKHHYFNQFIL